MPRITRRNFMAGSAAVGASIMWSSQLRAQGANEDIRIGMIGFNGRGAGLMEEARKLKGVRIVALCDADQRVIDRKVKEFEKRNEKISLTSQDMRKLLESKEIDAIVTATPNHWHSLVTVWACQAGKDIYVEKPVSHCIWEGRKAYEASIKYKRIVQAGTQRRSDVNFKAAVEWLQKGNIGKILYSRGFCYKPRTSIGKVTQATPIDKEIDYNLWCGPSHMGPLMRKKLHYDWHWVWETGNGDIGNQGIHEMDQARWLLGQNELAPRVYSWGGKFGYDDDATTPNTLISFFDYKPAPLIFEVRGLTRKKGDNVMDVYKPGDLRIGAFLRCEGGYFASGNNGGWVYDNEGAKVKQFTQDGAGRHMENFIKAVRSRKQEDVTAPILEGHLSSALCHMGNVSYRVGKDVPVGDVADATRADKQAMDSFERFKEHLVANEVDLAKEKIVLGPALDFDPKKEVFTGALADQANRYVKDTYREPFVVPENV